MLFRNGLFNKENFLKMLCWILPQKDMKNRRFFIKELIRINKYVPNILNSFIEKFVFFRTERFIGLGNFRDFQKILHIFIYLIIVYCVLTKNITVTQNEKKEKKGSVARSFSKENKGKLVNFKIR